jgi:predicted molibdopterin-dependent oxidoreductase YjgC
MTKNPPSEAPSLRTGHAVRRARAVCFTVDGRVIDGFEGESVAAALFAAGMRQLGRSPRDRAPRGLFCMMGSCQECLVWLGARKVCSCQIPVAASLEIETRSHREQRIV